MVSSTDMILVMGKLHRAHPAVVTSEVLRDLSLIY